ncbi:MAG: hypothetical protein RL391_1117, partial [Actinomycetota bacterium]|jgi:hypothetical protein
LATIAAVTATFVRVVAPRKAGSAATT